MTTLKVRILNVDMIWSYHSTYTKTESMPDVTDLIYDHPTYEHKLIILLMGVMLDFLYAVLIVSGVMSEEASIKGQR